MSELRTHNVYECCHADTCLSDYWGGHHRPHIQIAAYPMTIAELKRQLISEVNQDAVMGNLDGFSHRKAIAAIRRLKPAVHGQRMVFKDVVPEPVEDNTFHDYEAPYAFFVFMPLEV
jgi:hypothetical protein